MNESDLAQLQLVAAQYDDFVTHAEQHPDESLKLLEKFDLVLGTSLDALSEHAGSVCKESAAQCLSHVRKLLANASCTTTITPEYVVPYTVGMVPLIVVFLCCKWTAGRPGIRHASMKNWKQFIALYSHNVPLSVNQV